MKKLIFILSSFLMINASLAQSAEEAKALLQKTSEAMRAHQSFSIRFDFDFLNERVEPAVSQKRSGRIAVKGDNYHLHMGSIEQIRQGNTEYMILKDDEEVQITSYEEDEQSDGLTPTSLLSMYKKGYSYRMDGSAMVNGDKITYVLLKPRASEEIEKVRVGINTSKNHVHSIKQWGQNGAVTTITVKEFEANPVLPDRYFTFSEENYPGYYISRE